MNFMRRFAVPAIVLMATFARPQAPASHPHRIQETPGTGWTLLFASMDKMHADMAAVEPSGDGDVDFVRLMLPHHQAALEMAKTQLLYGKDPQLRRLAQEIIADQQSEIELMQLWLKQHPPSSPKPDQTPALDASKENAK
jgi:hypothetical protein